VICFKAEALKQITDLLPEPGQMSFIRQQQPLGLGHAVWCARNFIQGEPFAVILADDLILAKPGVLTQMVEAYNEVGGNVVAVEDVPRQFTNRYGILDVESDDGRLARARGLVEKPDPEVAPSTLSIIGRYILQPEVFDHLAKKERGAGGEIQLTDAIAKTIGTVPFHGYRFKGERFDCGQRKGFIEANIAFAMQVDDLRDQMIELLKKYA
jgi:UTP--glucose-1-phosphate uridylyltransferase